MTDIDVVSLPPADYAVFGQPRDAERHISLQRRYAAGVAI